jgi:hypothetical protein
MSSRFAFPSIAAPIPRPTIVLRRPAIIVLYRPERHEVWIGRWDREPQSHSPGSFLGRFDLLDLGGARFGGCGCSCGRVVLGVPVQIAALLPPTHSWHGSAMYDLWWAPGELTSHDRVSEIVLAMGILLDIFPLEIATATSTVR